MTVVSERLSFARRDPIALADSLLSLSRFDIRGNGRRSRVDLQSAPVLETPAASYRLTSLVKLSGLWDKSTATALMINSDIETGTRFSRVRRSVVRRPRYS